MLAPFTFGQERRFRLAQQDLEMFALPQVPFLLSGADSPWRARSCWADLRYFLEAPHVDRGFVTAFSAHAGPFGHQVDAQVSVGAALEELLAREGSEAQVAADPRPKYLANWVLLYFITFSAERCK